MSVPWRWNLGFAVFGAVLVFLISSSSNPPLTSLVRGLYAFLAFGLLGLFARIVLQQLLQPAKTLGGDKERAEEERGIVLDMTTPAEDDESLSRLMREQWTGNEESQSAGFEPLKPPRLVSIDEPNPEQVAQAIRRLNDD
ncbi:hypothetical protein SAMN05216312_11428 [Cohnella sp. OV330]|uniref:hypothetical protein n=1 Tax=Cohnella sp. OV330 TaxID=1855288 RepID=UPI0008E64747|nr:hypothetical protein [Cohnella sp. OV330]SFB57258.1 hypothetical protein SAMN05216312_11428 [Cohnella sp. OV330]